MPPARARWRPGPFHRRCGCPTLANITAGTRFEAGKAPLNPIAFLALLAAAIYWTLLRGALGDLEGIGYTLFYATDYGSPGLP